MISKANNNKSEMLIQLSIIATDHGMPNHLRVNVRSSNRMTQLTLKMILNLVCDKGDVAIKILHRILMPVAAADVFE